MGVITLTLLLIRIVGIFSDQLCVAGCLMVFLCHKDDAIFTCLEIKARMGMNTGS